MRTRLLAAAVLWILLAVVVRPATTAPAEPIRIGVITSLTGRFATFGKMQMAGYTVALKEINAKGGVQKRPLELLIEDDASAVPAALSAAERLLAKGVPLILGTYSSGVSKPLAGYMERREMPLIVSGSADDSITKPGSPYVFRAKSVSSTYARTLFDLFDALGGMQTVAILAGTGAFEQSVAAAAQAFVKVRNYKLVANEAYDRGLTDFRPLLNKFRTLGADIIFMVSYEEDAVAIMRQAKEVNLNPKIFAGAAAGFAIESFIKGAGDTAEWVFTATSWTPDVKYPGAQALYQNLKAALGGAEPSYHAAETYMALIVAADALNRARGLDKKAILEALAATDLMTPVGPVRFQNFAGFRNQNPIPMVVEQVQGGKFVTVFPTQIAPGRPRYPTPPWDRRTAP
ncbi:MAG: ABC transporter substrate-binding protein [Armatimonadota bacterium]|nr:ABC transporter substrate-binding protein [Armatimonadota bacterium]MDR7450484.1 ABC transporter substrate-binding protein [Armatimonadota bacterium]MDR7466382.1 ABC transporter substrate-binding protein [Armatimonadota bacterium]MDR7493104.1 ABC transporter substrate-binding protein [Armatimonadota bacterium]MDR7498139.1 ABC transporter substrate-binding protein [Armatimonadota bacterium]